MSSARAEARLEFAVRHSGIANPRIVPASSDASFRSYWRVGPEDGSGATRPQVGHIIMDAPVGKEDVRPWIEVDRRLRAAGLHAPEIFAVDAARGFVLIEDLGVRTYLPELDTVSVESLYADALDALLRMQTRVDGAGLPEYDRARLVTEMELLPEWFLSRHLGFTPSCDEWDIIESVQTLLVHAALEQPRTFVHRDYHSRNLLIVDDNNPGIIDFQDAVVGPLTYDLVSLLRDCYIDWDIARVDGWMEDYRRRLVDADLLGSNVDHARFRRWFDLMGVQRHLKVLGVFCRLWYRDGKRTYLAELPRVWRYTVSVAANYPELAELVALLRRAVGERDLTRANAVAPSDTDA
ncbi:MAG: phosphotransferase [Rhodanobacteraceae bacterium]